LLRFSFSEPLRYDNRTPLTRVSELVTHVEATLSIFEQHKIIYTCEHVNIIEIALQIKVWRDLHGDVRNDFVYESVDSDEVGICQFTRAADDTWTVGSCWAECLPAGPNGGYPTAVLDDAIDMFFVKLQTEATKRFAVNLHDLLPLSRHMNDRIVR
jgi:hypothetical protein